MADIQTEFDSKEYVEVTEARRLWLDTIWPKLPPLGSAIEYGCGVGVFSEYLWRKGLTVHGLDLRPENIAEATSRHSFATYARFDCDASSDLEFDLVPLADLGFVFGLLYHLQSPLVALQRICRRSTKLVIIETRVAAGEDNTLRLFAEPLGAAHNISRIVAVPTLGAIVTTLYESGFAYIYRPSCQPDHWQWDATKLGHGAA